MDYFVLVFVFAAVCYQSVSAETELERWRRQVVQNLTGYETHLMRQRRQTTCTDDEFPCKQGSRCIKASEVCDGQIQCPDNSDESFKICSRKEFTCPAFAYRCSYGACVDGDAKCDGVLDCADQSDELQPECEGVVSKVETNLCQELEFACLNGEQCIDMSRRCDGYVDCDDGTDETITECSRIHCEPFAFRCAYGACVDGDAPCDGVAQCRDGSDENAPKCEFDRPEVTNFHIDATTQPSNVPTFSPKPIPTREPPNRPTKPSVPANTPKPPRGKPCTLPAFPANGGFSSYQCEPGQTDPECLYKEGTKVNPGFTLHFECYAGYGLRGEADLTCRGGNWHPKIPFCSDVCEPLESNKLLISCNTERFQSLDCRKPMPSGSRANFRCDPATYMQISEPGYGKIVCKNGNWDRPLVENHCQPVCGRAIDTNFAQPVVSNGTRTEYGQFPWHAGIYQYDGKTKTYDLQCGGSLITSKVVISAAHCFYDEVPGDRELFAKNFTTMKIGVGKYYRAFTAKKDTLSQYSDIKSVDIGPEYQASLSSFSDDIAFIVLAKEVVFSFAVRPVCIDVGKQNIEEDQLKKGAIGQVVGWGLTMNQLPSDTLLLAEMPFVPRDECRRRISHKLATYVTSDKLCAGDKKSKVNVCPGDSGGGLVFYNPQNKAFYLRGVVSLGTSGCKGQDYALFTRVGKHAEQVERYMNLD